MQEEKARREIVLTELSRKNPTWGRVKLARESGLPQATVQRWQDRQKLIDSSSAKGDYSQQIPDGHRLKGVSSLYDAEGNLKAQWVKSNASIDNTLDALREAIEGIIEDVRGLAEPATAPESCNADLMVVYPVTDAHIGLYAWDEETGANFDTDIAQQKLLGCMRYLVDAAPPAETCLIPNLADFFHTDTSENRTMRSHNALDVDTRQARVFREGVKCYRRMIQMALEKHQKVYVKSGIGNHDDHSILSLAMVMQAYFENEPRVEVSLPINPFAYHTFGKNLLGMNHGEIKADRLPLIMATDQPAAWGATKHRTWLTGHRHTESVKSHPGVKVECFNATTAPDSWTHASGYRSVRDMQAITLHKERGEVGRIRIGVDYV